MQDIKQITNKSALYFNSCLGIFRNKQPESFFFEYFIFFYTNNNGQMVYFISLYATRVHVLDLYWTTKFLNLKSIEN